MQLSKEELEKLAAKYQDKADRAYRNYQETGVSRYDRERRNAEDMAEAFRAAANAADEHFLLGILRADFIGYASLADAALAEKAPREELEKILEGLISSAVACCHYKRREVIARE